MRNAEIIINGIFVFGGWGINPEILKPVFGEDAQYIDINRIMPKLFDSSQLKANWAQIVISECQLLNKKPQIIAGWSTGAMLAYAVSHILFPQKLILLSATPCFCRKNGYRFGVRQSVLDQMISTLEQDQTRVLRSFYEQCGLQYDQSTAPDYTFEQLSCGLLFLKQADLRPLAPTNIKPLFFHGRDDQIIPETASIYFCSQTEGIHNSFSGQHAFFTERNRLCLE
ncbi:MAG: hypothetical protein LBI42_04910 [Chitinispirillales bacterium]|jgi:surfactin synthase thioesterase subunit|nr:hypothetical protein [Chitinispirillales bacterium]